MKFLNGYKTYLIAAAILAYALLGVGLGDMDGAKFVELILEASALAGLRHGISK